MPKHGRGQWNLFETLHWYLKYLREYNDSSGTVKEEKIKTEQVKRKKMQIEIDKEMNILISKNEIMQENAKILLLTKQSLLNLEGRIIKKIARELKIDQSKIPLAKKYIGDEVREILNNLSKELLK